jgi:hypothetical protein
MRKTKYNRKKKKYNKTKKFMKMNCSPAVKNKTLIRDSCFTPDVLNNIKNAYNEYNPYSKITKTNPKEIWYDLKERLSTCKKEDCWLKEIKDENIRNKIVKNIFAPYQPKEWKKNRSAWLSNFDILDVLRQYEKSYKNFKMIGPTPIDFNSRPHDMNGQCVWEDLCEFSLTRFMKNNKNKTKIGIVFNLDRHDQGGSHWVSMFVDLEDKFIFYFDSAGAEIKQEIKDLANTITKQASELPEQILLEFHENYPVEHQMGNNECGMYSLFFIVTMLTNEVDEPENNKKFHNYKDKIDFFKKERITDRYMNKYRNIFFNVE